MLIRRTEREARRGSLAALGRPDRIAASTAAAFCAARVSPPAASAALGTLPLVSVRKAKAGPPPAPGAQVVMRKSVCTHCAVGCTVTAEVANGVWIGQEPSWDSPINRGSHCAKGACGARARLRRAAAQISAEARRRPMDPHQLGSGDRRDRRQADGDPRAIGPGFGLLARLGEIHQRGRLPVPQARRLLGHQQHRPPGADLPFDDGHRGSQYLGLRRDDQQLQRYSQFEDADHLGRQSGRSSSGVACSIC